MALIMKTYLHQLLTFHLFALLLYLLPLLYFFYLLNGCKKFIFNSTMNEEAYMQLGMVMGRGELESSPPPRITLSGLILAPPSMTRKTSLPHPHPVP